MNQVDFLEEAVNYFNRFEEVNDYSGRGMNGRIASHVKIGTCIDIGIEGSPLTKIGDATDWDRLTGECNKIDRDQFFKYTKQSDLSNKAINFGHHPKHDFLWAETRHPDKIGTIHHYFFRK